MPNAIDDLLISSDAYRWDDDSGEFLKADGSEFREDELIGLIILLLLLGRRRAKEIAESFAADEITLNEWHAEMITLIKGLYLSAAVVAYGSLKVVEKSHLPAVELLVEDQLKYLNRFSDQIASEQVKTVVDGIAAAGFVNRAELYASSTYPAFNIMFRDRKQTEGAEWEQRILDPGAEHCPDCLDAAGFWAPVGELPEIGDSACNVNCRCEMIYSSSNTEPVEEE